MNGIAQYRRKWKWPNYSPKWGTAYVVSGTHSINMSLSECWAAGTQYIHGKSAIVSIGWEWAWVSIKSTSPFRFAYLLLEESLTDTAHVPLNQHRYRQDHRLIHSKGTPPERQTASEGLLSKVFGQLITSVEKKWTLTFTSYREDVIVERCEVGCEWQDDKAF